MNNANGDKLTVNRGKSQDQAFARACEFWNGGKSKPAFRIFQKLAKQGYDCYLNLGVMYDNGDGVQQSHRWALYWYHKGLATSSCASAANNIGTVYRDMGDKRLAIHWFEEAVRMGDGDANLELAYLYLRKPLLDIAKARDYLQQTIDTEHVTEGSRETAARLLDWLDDLHSTSNRVTSRTPEVRTFR